MGKTRVLTISSDPALMRFIRKEPMASRFELSFRQDTGDDLRSIIEAERPDLILLDIMMPNLDGIEVCLRIRQWCLVPVLMVSAWGAGEGRLRGLNLGADGYLTEPFDMAGLIRKIDEALRRSLAAARVVIRNPQTDPTSRRSLN